MVCFVKLGELLGLAFARFNIIWIIFFSVIIYFFLPLSSSGKFCLPSTYFGALYGIIQVTNILSFECIIQDPVKARLLYGVSAQHFMVIRIY